MFFRCHPSFYYTPTFSEKITRRLFWSVNTGVRPDACTSAHRTAYGSPNLANGHRWCRPTTLVLASAVLSLKSGSDVSDDTTAVFVRVVPGAAMTLTTIHA